MPAEASLDPIRGEPGRKQSGYEESEEEIWGHLGENGPESGRKLDEISQGAFLVSLLIS
jgi:hypothetical protein